MARFFTYCGDYVLNYNTGEQAGRSSRHPHEECCVLILSFHCCGTTGPRDPWLGPVLYGLHVCPVSFHFGRKTKICRVTTFFLRRGLFLLWLELFQLPSRLWSGFCGSCLDSPATSWESPVVCQDRKSLSRSVWNWSHFIMRHYGKCCAPERQ